MLPTSPPSIRPLIAAASLAALAVVGCGGSPKYTRRMVETPAGYTQTLGPAQNPAYLAKVAMEHNVAHITVYERSECPVTRLRVIERVEETLDEDAEVVQRETKGALKIADGPGGVVPCEERFARVPLQLSFGGNTYPLGDTSPTGELRVDLASIVKPGTRGVEVGAGPGVLLVAGRPVGEVPLGGLAQQQQRLDAILAELGPILGKPATKLTDAEVTRAYTLYEQMSELAPDDARVVGMQRRFVEVIGGFRDLAKTESLKRNLAALSEAKDLLKVLGSEVPNYVQVSIAENRPTPDAIAWAQAAALMQFRANPALCAGGFEWSRVANATGEARLAFSYLRYAFDDGNTRWIGSACK